jgi:poly-gamma-glutamate capsule biosynthesis protein CapA/YwtB (metallophosphatase superfamily)
MSLRSKLLLSPTYLKFAEFLVAAMSDPNMPPRSRFSINFTGDVMLGRLIDQLRSTHVSNPSEGRIISHFVMSNSALRIYSAKSPWGNMLPLFYSSNLNIINLETSVTTHPVPWPNKVFNYRMHPANVDFLREARVNYASLANNHSLDFCEEGLRETVATLANEGIAFAGAGKTKDEALKPAKLELRPLKSLEEADGWATEGERYDVHVYSASDHPRDWASVPGFHLIDYSSRTKERLRSLLTAENTAEPALKVFSVHWGPNYAWQPSSQTRNLAHYLVDECGVDVIHGHSSHHVQGVEVYKGKPIIYGCGDFVDDYAIDATFRNDISALWRLIARPKGDAEGLSVEGSRDLVMEKLEIYPTRCNRFVTDRLKREEEDYEWSADKLRQLSGEFGTKIREEKAEDGGPVLVVDLQ